LIRERLEEAAVDKLVLFPNPTYDPPAFEGTAADVLPVKYPRAGAQSGFIPGFVEAEPLLSPGLKQMRLPPQRSTLPRCASAGLCQDERPSSRRGLAPCEAKFTPISSLIAAKNPSLVHLTRTKHMSIQRTHQHPVLKPNIPDLIQNCMEWNSSERLLVHK
jgi:hypothetical protein